MSPTNRRPAALSREPTVRDNAAMRWKSHLRLLVWSGVALFVVLAAGYLYVTRPAALRAKLTMLFARLDLRVEHIGAISFSLTDGLAVHDMLVEAEGESPLYAADRVSNPPALLRVPRARVRIDPWSLLTGEPRIREIKLKSPMISVVWPAWGTNQLARTGGDFHFRAPSQDPNELPRLSIEGADIAVYLVKDGRLRLQRRWLVNGVGQVEGGASAASYLLRFDQVGGAVSAVDDYACSLAELSWRGDALIAKLGWVDLETAQSLLPRAWRTDLAELDLAGRARASRLVVEGSGIVEAEVRLDQVSFSAPIETEANLDPGDRYLQVADVGGVLRYLATSSASGPATPAIRRGDVDVRLSGQIGEAPANLSLNILGARLDANGDGDAPVSGLFGMAGVGARHIEMSVDVDALELPTADAHPAFVTSERLPGVVRSSLRKYAAEGPINFHLRVWNEDAGDDWRYSGEIEGAGASCTYYRFPYRVEDVRGSVRFSNQGVVFDGLGGRHGSGRLRMDGRLADTSSWTAFELTFTGRNIATDADLYEALPQNYQKLWRHADPVALCDVTTVLRREQGSAKEGSRKTDVKVDARLLAGSIKLLNDDKLDNVSGVLHIADDTVELDGLQGDMGGALVRLDGELSLDENGSPKYDLRVEAAGAALDRVSEVRDGSGHSVGRIRFDGVGDIWGRINSDASNSSRRYTVHVTDGVLSGFDETPGWDHVEGWLTLSDREQRILSLKASRDAGTLSVSGALPGQLGLDRPIDLELQARDADLKRLTPQLVPGRWSHVREALGLAGGGELSARFYPREHADSRVRQAADVRISAERMKPTPVPLDLRDIEAHATLHAGGFELHKATARYGKDARMEISGAGGWSEDDNWSDISIEAWDLDLSAELIEAFPTPLSSLLKRMSPSGRVHLKLDRMHLRGLEKLEWNVAGDLLLDEAELQIGARLSDFHGELGGSCQVLAGGGVRLETEFKIARGLLSDRPIERWEGRLISDPENPLLHLKDARGRFCDGEVVGFATIDPDASTYELAFTLHNVSLKQFLSGDASDDSGGRIDGHVFLRGRTDDPSQRVGGGEVRIRGASLLSSPVTASVVEASKQQKRAIGDEVDQAEARFVWEDDELKFTHLDIHSRDLRLIGEGRWNMDTDAISMTLLGATPEDALRLFPITDLLELAGQELLQYEVSGTRANPRVKVKPLHNLTDPLRKLFGDGAEPGDG